MTDINRRTFIKGAALGLGAGLVGGMGLFSYSNSRKAFLPKVERKMADFGVCKSVKVTNISETSWFYNDIFMSNVRGAGGLLVDQYTFNWPPLGNGKGLGKGNYSEAIAKLKPYLPNKLEKAWEIAQENSVNADNPGGFSCLIEVESMEGKVTKYLLDTGWSYEWMDEAFRREGIDKMLANNEIEALIVSHEHMDHYWGLPVTLKYRPDIPIYYPSTFFPTGKQYLKDSGHIGKETGVPKGLYKIQPGMALYMFEIPIILKVYGEMSLYFNVKDLGLVSVTGCCHQGIILFADTAYRELKYERDRFHGLYGGLHISPFEDWDPKYDDLVIGLRKWELEKIGCNHCTGLMTARKFIDANYPVVRGTARFRSQSDVYLGNGDTITFGV